MRQKLVLGRSHREVVASGGVSIGKVPDVMARACSLSLGAAGVEAMSDAELDADLYPKATAASLRPGPDCAALHLELRRKGVTLALLHVEFVELHPGGLGYSAFCDRYREWASYRAEKQAMQRVALPDEDALLQPAPVAGGGPKPEAELDRLSNIIRNFNEQFATLFKDADRVAARFLGDIAPKVAADPALPEREAEHAPDGAHRA